MEINNENEKRRGLSDGEVAARLRISETQGFLQLAELLGNDLQALKAMREETEFILTRPGLPRGQEFADKVRGWLISNKLGWSQENLQKAVDAVLSRPVALAHAIDALMAEE